MTIRQRLTAGADAVADFVDAIQDALTSRWAWYGLSMIGAALIGVMIGMLLG